MRTLFHEQTQRWLVLISNLVDRCHVFRIEGHQYDGELCQRILDHQPRLRYWTLETAAHTDLCANAHLAAHWVVSYDLNWSTSLAVGS